MKNFLIITTVSLISAGAAYFYGRNDSHCNSVELTKFSVTDTNSSNNNFLLQEKIHTLENNNVALHEQINKYKTEIARLTGALSIAATSSINSALSNEEIERRVNAREQGREFTDYMSAFSGSKNMNQDMEHKFVTEAIDHSWAGDYESKVKKLFQDDQELSYFVPEGVECRTNKCQIKVHVSDNEEANRLTEKFSKLVNANDLGVQPSAVVSVPDFNRGIVSIYIAKDSTTKLYQ